MQMLADMGRLEITTYAWILIDSTFRGFCEGMRLQCWVCILTFLLRVPGMTDETKIQEIANTADQIGDAQGHPTTETLDLLAANPR